MSSGQDANELLTQFLRQTNKELSGMKDGLNTEKHNKRKSAALNEMSSITEVSGQNFFPVKQSAAHDYNAFGKTARVQQQLTRNLTAHHIHNNLSVVS
jgi:hypothetical protein